MEVKMHFKLPDDAEDLKHCQSGYDYFLALTHIADDIFRPNRKHGYPGVLNALVGDEESEIITALEEMFYEILTKYGISLT